VVEHLPSKQGAAGSIPAARFGHGPSSAPCSVGDVKVVEKQQARRLRRERGLSIKEIADRLGVSKSSVSLWVRDIDLSPAQQDALRQKNRLYGPQALARSALVETRRARRIDAQEEGRMYARLGDPLHTAGCMLYWAEGSKHRNSVQLTNSDPALVRFFVHFLREFFLLRDEEIRITCNLFADHAERQWQVEQFWLDHLRLPRTSLRKSTVNRYSKYSKRKRQNKLPWGTCRVTVHRTRVVQSIYGAIQEYASITKPAWLD
jgi:transcriptional regulator with XRE-family HTH domain